MGTQVDPWNGDGPPVTRRRGESPAPSGLASWAEGHVTGIGVFAEPTAKAAGDLVLRLGRTSLPFDAAVRHDWAGGRIDLMLSGGSHQVRVVLAGSGAELVETVAARAALAVPASVELAAAAAAGQLPTPIDPRTSQMPDGTLALPRDLQRARRGERWRFASSVAALDSIAFEQAVRDMHDDLDEAARAISVTYMAPPGLDRQAPWAGTIGAVACMPTDDGVAWRAWTVLPATGEVVVTTSELVRER